eukprot:PhM_4_TR9297/c0_g1_i1/m.84778
MTSSPPINTTGLTCWRDLSSAPAAAILGDAMPHAIVQYPMSPLRRYAITGTHNGYARVRVDATTEAYVNTNATGVHVSTADAVPAPHHRRHAVCDILVDMLCKNYDEQVLLDRATGYGRFAAQNFQRESDIPTLLRQHVWLTQLFRSIDDERAEQWDDVAPDMLVRLIRVVSDSLLRAPMVCDDAVVVHPSSLMSYVGRLMTVAQRVVVHSLLILAGPDGTGLSRAGIHALVPTLRFIVDTQREPSVLCGVAVEVLAKAMDTKAVLAADGIELAFRALVYHPTSSLALLLNVSQDAACPMGIRTLIAVRLVECVGNHFEEPDQLRLLETLGSVIGIGCVKDFVTSVVISRLGNLIELLQTSSTNVVECLSDLMLATVDLRTLNDICVADTLVWFMSLVPKDALLMTWPRTLRLLVALVENDRSCLQSASCRKNLFGSALEVVLTDRCCDLHDAANSSQDSTVGPHGESIELRRTLSSSMMARTKSGDVVCDNDDDDDDDDGHHVSKRLCLV